MSRAAIDRLDDLAGRQAATDKIGIYLGSLRAQVNQSPISLHPECDRLRLAVDLLAQSLRVVEAEMKAARVALVEEVQS